MNNPPPSKVTVASLAELRSVHTAPLALGTRAAVLDQAIPNFYLLETALPDGADVLSPLPQAAVGKATAKWLRSNLVDGGGGAILPETYYIDGVAGSQATDQGTPVEIGAIAFDPTLYGTPAGVTRTIRFEAVIQSAIGDNAQTTSVELFNKTDVVTVATLTTTVNAATFVASADLVVPTDLPNAAKLYVVRLSQVGGGPGDNVICKLARLRVLYT